MSSSPDNLKLALSMLACAAALSVSTNVLAQADPIEHCRETADNKKERIACLEAVITGLISPGQPVAAVVVEAEEQPRLAETEPAAEDMPAGLGSEQARANQESKSKEGRRAHKKRVKAEAVNATLVDFARTKTGRLILVLDNGQVWSQRSSDRQKVRLRDGDTPEVTVRRGTFSGYRMELSKPNVTIVVERLK